MNISGEKLDDLGRSIQKDWYGKMNMLTSTEKYLWDVMNRPVAGLFGTLLSLQTDNLLVRYISIFKNLYTDIHELSYPFATRSSGSLEGSEIVADTLEMTPFSRLTPIEVGLTSNIQTKPAGNSVPDLNPEKPSKGNPDATASVYPSSRYAEEKRMPYSNIGSEPDGHSRGYVRVEPERKNTNRLASPSDPNTGKVGNEYFQNLTEDQPGKRRTENHTTEKRTETGSPNPEKFMEIKGWNQLGEIFQNVERDRPEFYLNEEQLPDTSTLYPLERSESENRASEWTGIAAGKNVMVGNLSTGLSAESTSEEPGIQGVSKQLPTEVDFDEWFTEMQWRLNLEYKRYYGR